MDYETENGFDDGAAVSHIPSCQGCKRRKLKCSRDQPICSHCRRLDSPCVYDPKKGKPGIKLGAVGNLSRRVEALEDALLQRSQEESQCPHIHAASSTPQPNTSQNVVEILSLLAGELQKLNSSSAPVTAAIPRERNLELNQNATSPAVSLNSSRHSIDSQGAATGDPGRPRKRRRVDSCGNPNVDLALTLGQDLEDITTSLPPAALLEDVINTYFDVIQPWIPVIHETRFRKRLQSSEDLPQLVVILHAIVVAALRFVDGTETPMPSRAIEQQMLRSRNFVKLTAMDGLSVENLQALIILAFTDIGNGDASRAWALVGSLTRTVEYLQLSIESDHENTEPLLKPLPTTSSAKDWTVEEEHRRVFWTIFCLDRYCSVTTGWNTSLTSDDVQRKLPADGGLWHKEDPVTTPFFGIWDKSAAKIGNSIAFLTGHYPSPEQTSSQGNTSTSGSSVAGNSVDMSTVGAFAYNIEATESLSRITTYFLQQKINFKDRHQVSNWLTRFKELDLRLVHWKMFLPQRWRDSNISRQPEVINMDPNLTLAHVTHNASMILLHQSIAYPKAHWSETFKLPSSCSADTCQVAAIETTTITQKYLKHTPKHMPVASQFAFCVFVSARVLLVQWQYYKTELASDFWILVESLEEMARRWIGHLPAYLSTHCLHGNYATQLRQLHDTCQADPDFEIDIFGYTGGGAHKQATSPFYSLYPAKAVQNSNNVSPTTIVQRTDGSIDAQQPLSPDDTSRYPSNVQDSEFQRPAEVPVDPSLQTTNLAIPDNLPSDRLSAISHTLMDEHFMAMDRIISFDDMIFTAQSGSSAIFPWMNGHSGGIE